METLINILKQFDKKRRTKKVNAKQWNENAVAECFKDCAKQILCDGYFLVNDKYIIDLGAIELYYHEEDGEIKDTKMYHTNAQVPKAFKKRLDNYPNQLPLFYKVLKENEGYLPYLKKGSFNLHQSGIDVTFENDDNEQDKYRASFLIRSYRMFEKDDPNREIILYDPCSSHIYEDLYNAGLLFWGNEKISIQWVKNNEFGKEIEDEPCPRRNLDLKPYQFQIKGLKDKEIK